MRGLVYPHEHREMPGLYPKKENKWGAYIRKLVRRMASIQQGCICEGKRVGKTIRKQPSLSKWIIGI